MFNVFKKILQAQPISDAEAAKVSEFVMLRWLSGDARLIGLAASLNAADTKGIISVKDLCNAIGLALNKQIRFIKYPKAAKEDEQREIVAESFARYFEVSVTEALEYIDFCLMHCPDEIDQIKTIFKIT